MKSYTCLSFLSYCAYTIRIPNKKEYIENLSKKSGEVLGLERADQKEVDELIEMKLLKSDS